MDELEISGKRYISSRRAGKEHRYHPDYIGQLIRGGKVPGQKVGRAWYVDAEALQAYFNGEKIEVSQDEAVPVVVSTEEAPNEVIESTEQAEELFVEEKEERVSTVLTVERTHQVGRKQPHNWEPVQVPPPISIPPRGLQYIADDTEPLPKLSKQPTQPRYEEAAPAYEAPVKVRRSFSKLQILIIGVLAFAGAAVLSSGLIAQVRVVQGQVAATEIHFSK